MIPSDPASRLRAISAAIESLLYPSESDEPFDVFRWGGADGVTARQAVAAHGGAQRVIVQTPIDRFFSQLDQADGADRFRKLRRTLETELHDVAIFRVGEGEVRVDVYLIGRLAAGDWAGVHTVSVET